MNVMKITWSAPRKVNAFHRWCILIILALFYSTMAVGGIPAAEPAEKIPVFVSVLPQAYFVEQIGGEYTAVQVLVGPGQSPATYEPTPKQMSALAETPLYFRIGVPFERHLIGKIEKTFRALKIIDTREGVPLREIGGTEHHGHDHGGEKDPHIWLSPRRVKIQAAHICRALVEHDPNRADFYNENLEKFKSRLDSADNAIKEKLAPFKGSRFYAFHPSYGYFGDDYGLVQLAVESEGKEPSARQMAALIERAREEKVRVIFVQPQFAVKTAETIARAIDGRVVELDPLSKDYFNNLEYMSGELARALDAQGSEK